MYVYTYRGERNKRKRILLTRLLLYIHNLRSIPLINIQGRVINRLLTRHSIAYKISIQDKSIEHT